MGQTFGKEDKTAASVYLSAVLGARDPDRGDFYRGEEDMGDFFGTGHTDFWDGCVGRRGGIQTNG